MGTPAFASPEQLRGDEVDARSDIYAVGATLFTLLTARAPFEGDNAVQVVANVIDTPPAASRSGRDLPRA
jgi:serine/threonine protein kinase